MKGFLPYLIRYTVSVLLKPFQKNYPYVFPLTVGEFRFVECITPEFSRNASYQFALYENDRKERAIAKSWSGRIKTFAYYTLVNEIQIYQQLQKAQHKLQKAVSYKKQICIPEFIAGTYTGNTVFLLLQYVTGQPIGEYHSQDDIHAFLAVKKYIQALNGALEKDSRSALPLRSGITYVLLYPLLASMAMLVHPALRREILYGIPIFIRGIPQFFRKRELMLSHRDLHGKNIFRSGSDLWLIDFQLACLTFPEYDYISGLAYQWENEQFRTKIFAILSEIHNRPAVHDPYIRALIVFFVTHMLTSNNFSEVRYQNFADMLTWVVEHKNQRISNPSIFSLLYKLFFIVPTYLHSSMSYIAGRRSEVALPQTIGPYTLQEAIPARRYPFALGYYLDPVGKTVVAKIWQGEQLSMHAFNLLHESTVCQMLTYIRKRIGNALPEKFADIQTPEFIDKITDRKIIALIMEPAQGTPLTHQDFVTQIEIHKKAKEYLSFLGTEMTEQERTEISSKTIPYFLWINPIIVVAALIRHLEKSVQIIKGEMTFLRGIAAMRNGNVALIHGDLHTDNILLTKAGMTVIDLEQVMFTYPEYDLIATLSSQRSTEEFLQHIRELVIRNSRVSVDAAQRLAAVGAFISIHNLTSNLSPAHTDHYYKILQLMTEIGITKKHTYNSMKRFLPSLKHT